MKEKIQRFMMGRYGSDTLNKFLFGVTLVLLITSILFDSNFLNLLALLSVMLECYREMFRKGIMRM